ncbi:poly-beta-1,6-N-acetyl-D-glucosamine N-deacetylase PgaB [Lysobacter sp. LF1]|uniref:Poly-beta-1,6-N-acetyl-D-glucosamine N-deacetylase PgaB n=1 Tax=Lysobacter stagni TaxID=3045172 RepID=A0ABT6XIF1_9GAMM|nr:poly-beta-1,6-N-acetyl-D-glucosamine N-deacetylase PgaB [Lysobacter sp. LF1]MDI9239923.1 poly-beta-1,6-N-acetyl-D-glucosamine N-deacetylase PgaB [Lysobacter sp. LF1]
MRSTIYWICMLLSLATVSANAMAQAPQRFVSIALHDVVDTPAELDGDSVTSDRLVALFEWLAGNGWTAISLDDIERARQGIQPLPPRAVLLTADDGRRSLYTRVYPLALAYRTPIVAALVGEWMDTPEDGTIAYGPQRLPRSAFITWEQAREMQASGLVEFASHSHALHDVVIANPQGNPLPAAQNLRYADGRYEGVAAFRSRIGNDLTVSRDRIRQELGAAPRAIVWPYGRYNQDGLDAATAAGFRYALTLTPAPADATRPLEIGRFLPTSDPTLGIVVANLRFEDPWPSARRIVEVDPAQLVGADTQNTNQRLGRIIDRLVKLGATHVVLDAATLSADGRIVSAWFPNSHVPVRDDVLSRFSAQMHSRAGVDVVVRLPHAAVLRTLGDRQRALALYGELAAHVPFEALLLEDVPALGDDMARASDAPWDVRRRREASATSAWPHADAFALEAFRVAERARPELALYWLAPPTHRLDQPSALADVTLVPRAVNVPPGDIPPLHVPLSRRIGVWWTLPSPADARVLVSAIRAYQIRGGTVFGWRPDDPAADMPMAAAVAPAFSSREAPGPGVVP